MFFKLVEDLSASTYERIVLSWAEGRVRERTWALMQKGYLDMGLGWAGRLTGLVHGDLDGWVLGRGGQIEGRKAKMR